MSQNIAKSVPQHSQASSSQFSKVVELFLTTLINGKDLDFYLRVMQGICGMQPSHSFHRQVVFEGPRDRKLLGIPAPLMRQRDPKRSQQWISLNEPLSRQAYYLNAFWELNQRSFGRKDDDGNSMEDSGHMDLNQTPGTLRWAEWADASLQRGLNSRQIVQIESEQNLLGALKAMNHRPTSENVRETYLYVHDNVVVEFTRHYYLPGQMSSPIQQIAQRLPPREDLIPCDGQPEEGKWLVTAYRLVSNGTDQELMQDGVKELLAFQDLLKDCLDLRMIKTNERHDIDPRVK